MSLPFTGDFNLDALILNNLNDQDLGSLCQTDSRARDICADDRYWMNRTLHFYGGHLGSANKIREKYLQGRTWKEYYKFIAPKLEPGNSTINMSLPFTGDFNLDTLVLNNLNDQDLGSVCQTHKLARYICTNDRYWMIRTLHFYGRYLGSASVIRERYLCGRTWEQYYKFLAPMLAEAKSRTRDPTQDKAVEGPYRLFAVVFEDIMLKYMDNNIALKLENYNPEAFELFIQQVKETVERLIMLEKDVNKSGHLGKITYKGEILGRKEIRGLAGLNSGGLRNSRFYYGQSLKYKSNCPTEPNPDPRRKGQMVRKDFEELLINLTHKLNALIQNIRPLKALVPLHLQI